MKIQYSKIKIKRSSISGVIPTMGPTANHTDGSWNGTDIYPSEIFYNLADKKLWIGGIGEIIPISTSIIIELTYAEALALKDVNGSPVGEGLIIGAKYKITDKGDDGLLLTAIDIDKFSTYVDELIASPVGIRSAIYDFDNDVLTYPSGANYKSYVALLTQTGTNAPTATIVYNDLSGNPTWSYTSVGIYKATLTGQFTSGKTVAFIAGSQQSVSPQTTTVKMIYVENTNDVYVTNQTIIQGTPTTVDLTNDEFYSVCVEIRVYN